MQNEPTTTISSEADAWKLLADWLEGAEIGEVDFVGWPVLKIKIKGEEYNSSLNASQMAALVEFKRAVGRAYSAIAHGSYDMRKLKKEEEEQLEFTTRVKEGSSVIDTDLTPLVQALAEILTTHSEASLIAGVVIGLALVARPVILKHYENRAKQLEADERKQLLDLSLSVREQKQYDLFERAVKRLSRTYPQLKKVIPDAAGGFWRFASASTDASQLSVAGIDMTQDDLEILSERRKHRPSEYSEVQKTFSVIGIQKRHGAYRVQLESPTLSFTAVFRRPQFSEARFRQLMKCMQDNIKIDAKVEVRVIEESQIIGRLMRFTPVSGDSE